MLIFFRNRLSLVLIFIAVLSTSGAQNLVSNASFEVLKGCPNGNYTDQVDSLTFWTNPTTASPDCYNECSSNFLDVPNNFWGYQHARTGVGYVGIYIYEQQLFSGSNYREYIQATLTQPLQANKCYYFEMYINLSNTCKKTASNIEVLFSDTLINDLTQFRLNFTPQISNPIGNYPDTLNWTKVSGSYLAKGGENYLIIGNFQNNNSLDSISYSNASRSSVYFFIDDILLKDTLLGSCAALDVPQFNLENLKVFPNPTSSSLKVELEKIPINQKLEIVIFNSLGQQLFDIRTPFRNTSLDLSKYPKGIYIIRLRLGNSFMNKRVVIY